MYEKASIVSDTSLTSEPYDSDIALKQNVPPMSTLNMFYTTSRLNATIHSGTDSSTPQYYLESTTFSLKPSLYLREGDSKKSPMVAFAQTNWALRNLTIGLGDYEKNAPADLTSERLLRDKNTLRRSDYHVTIWIDAENGSQQPKTLTWRKDKSALGKTVYVCIDQDGFVQGRLRSGGLFNWKKAGEIDVSDNLSQDEKRLFLLSAGGVWALEGLNYRSIGRGYEKGSSSV